MDLDSVLKRLALIKYMYNVGADQANKPEPVCWVAVLTFHDAAELFLQFVAEYLDIKERLKDVSFMSYWSLINPVLKKQGKSELAQIISMERLNKARVDFKHYGHPPSKSVILGDFRAHVANFFEENTGTVFGVKFSDVSLVDVVNCEEAKKNLKEAEDLLKQDRKEDSLDKVALAFAALIDDYEDRKRDKWGRNPFFFGRSMIFLDKFSIGASGELGNFIDRTKESIEALQDAVKILSFGLDYKRYARFWYLSPHVTGTLGKPHLSRRDRSVTGQLTVDDVNFCISFVVESALALQEFDFEVMKKAE